MIMTIEVRQLLVKSTVTQRIEADGERSVESCDTEELKAEILAECREMVLELLRTRKER